MADQNTLLFNISASSSLGIVILVSKHTYSGARIPTELIANTCLAVYKEFLRGNFTVKKTGCAFSDIALDQAHEQNNASVKDDGGTVGLTQNLQTLRRWMVFEPEIEKFQASIKKPETESDLRHHEQTKSVQVTFFNQVKALSNLITEMENPFTDDSNDLLVLDPEIWLYTLVINSMRNLEQTGQKQYETFVKECLVNQS